MAAAVQAASAVEVSADLAAAPVEAAVQDADSRLFAEINKLENLDFKILEFFCYDTRSCLRKLRWVYMTTVHTYASSDAYTSNKKEPYCLKQAIRLKIFT